MLLGRSRAFAACDIVEAISKRTARQAAVSRLCPGSCVLRHSPPQRDPPTIAAAAALQSCQHPAVRRRLQVSRPFPHPASHNAAGSPGQGHAIGPAARRGECGCGAEAGSAAGSAAGGARMKPARKEKAQLAQRAWRNRQKARCTAGTDYCMSTPEAPVCDIWSDCLCHGEGTEWS